MRKFLGAKQQQQSRSRLGYFFASFYRVFHNKCYFLKLQNVCETPCKDVLTSIVWKMANWRTLRKLQRHQIFSGVGKNFIYVILLYGPEEDHSHLHLQKYLDIYIDD